MIMVHQAKTISGYRIQITASKMKMKKVTQIPNSIPRSADVANEIKKVKRKAEALQKKSLKLSPKIGQRQTS